MLFSQDITNQLTPSRAMLKQRSLKLSTILLSSSLLLMAIANRATAQVITNISIDPYNDSSYQSIPADQSIPLDQPAPADINQVKKIPNNQNPETLYINGKPTPKPVSNVSGNLTTSPQTLPAIPELAPPYSKPQISNNNSNNSSVSVSPWDVTPKDSQNQPRKIDFAPKKTTPSTPSQKPVARNQGKKIPSSQTRGTRRNLKDILIQSGQGTGNNSSISSLPSSNQGIYKVLVRVNNAEEKSQLKSIYPEAFSKTVKGQSFLQIGIFSAQENAQQISNSLTNMGYKVLVTK